MPQAGIKRRRLWHIRRRILRGVIWLSVILLIGRVLYGQTGKRILRPLALRQIKQLAGGNVSVGRVEFHGPGTVVIHDVIIGPPPEQFDRQMLTARTVRAEFSLLSFLRFRPRFRRIVLTGAYAHIQYDRDLGRWNMSCLNITHAARAGARLPEIILADGVIRLSTIRDGDSKTHIIVGVEATFASVPKDRGAYGFFVKVNNDMTAFAGSYLRGKWRSGPTGSVVLNEGRIIMGRSPVFGNTWSIRDLELEVEYDQKEILLRKLQWRTGPKSRGSIQGVISDYRGQGVCALRIDLDDWFLTDQPTDEALVYSRDMLELLGEDIGGFFEMFCPTGTIGVDLSVSGRLSDMSLSALTGEVYLDDVSVCCAKFPYPLEHITGTIEIPRSRDPADILLRDLRCRRGRVNMVISGSAVNADGDWGYDIRLSSDNMRFDETLYEALDDRQKSLWRTFSPTGNSKIDFRLRREPGGAVETRLVVDLDGAGALYEHFPYPLENLTGKVSVRHDRITLENIVSRYQTDNRLITLNGNIVGIASDRPRFNIVIDANSVPVDATLRAALPEKQRRFYEHFDLDAVTDSTITVFPNEVGRRPVEYIAKVRIHDASMVYRDFPVPMTDVDVDAELTADVIVLKKMTARSGSGQIAISGRIHTTTDDAGGPGYCLSINADQLELDEDWLSRLPGQAARAAAKLRPRGRINITGNINANWQGAGCPEFGLSIDCLGNSFCVGESARSLRNVTGHIEITGRDIRLKNFRIPGMVLDEKLAKELPRDIRRFYEAVSPDGVIDLNIDEGRFSRDAQGRGGIDLAGNAVLVDCGFGDTGGVRATGGVLDFKVSYRPDEGLTAAGAEMSAASLVIRNRTLTDVHLAVDYNPTDRIFTGRDFSARYHGGRISGDVGIVRDENGRPCYRLEMVFDGVEFGGMMSDGISTPNGRILSGDRGLLGGSINLRGVIGQPDSNTGRVNISVRDMQLARRSLLGKIIAAIQLDEPTDYIFSEMSVDAFVRGSDLVFQEVYMWGDSSVLRGTGLVDLRSDAVDLEFASYGSVRTSRPSFLETLARGLGPAVIKVEVSGSVERPDIATTTLPALTAPLGILGDGS